MAEIANNTAWLRLIKRVARKTNNSCDAEDFLNSAYLRLDRYRLEHEVKNPSAFLVKAAVNLSIDKLRHDRLASENSAQLEICDNSPLPDEIIEARVRLERVKQGLARLPVQTREVLLMRRLEGRDYEEIATHFGISKSTVERIVAKATMFLLEWAEGW